VREDGKVLLLQFVSAADASREEDLLRRLGDDVAALGLGRVAYRYADEETGEAKAAPGILEWVSVALAAVPALAEVLRLAGQWARRGRRPVRVRIGDEELVLENMAADRQDAVIQAFLAGRRDS
jgi:hypothetical protein